MPAYYKNFTISPVVIAKEIEPIIEAIAKRTSVKIIDLFTPMLGKNSLAPDDIHPNTQGMGILAQEVYKAIKSF